MVWTITLVAFHYILDFAIEDNSAYEIFQEDAFLVYIHIVPVKAA